MGEKHSVSEITHVTNGERTSLPRNLMKSIQLAIKNGKLTNRNAINQKQDKHIRRTVRQTILAPFTILQDR